jgi:hypothetical protein
MLMMALASGCMQSRAPTDPGVGNGKGTPQLAESTNGMRDGPYRLFGEWTFFIDEAHDRVDVVTEREARFHLNALKFLESYCSDCLQITKVKKNTDSTIDLTVKIKHPFPGHPEYTGFDVKGIIMFNGSYQVPWSSVNLYPFDKDWKVSWRNSGDPEVLNPDGYTPRWCPDWQSGSSQPIFNYLPGKYTSGTPTANINAFLNFYTDEQRHMFRVNGSVSRTYHIYLPPGPVVAGYAVDASWEPPIKTPVTDPLTDFPESANQPESYHLKMVVNGGNVITEGPCCGDYSSCSTAWVENLYWFGDKPPSYGFAFIHGMSGGWGFQNMTPMPDCSPDEPPYNKEWQAPGPTGLELTTSLGNGSYRGVAAVFLHNYDKTHIAAYDLFEFTIDVK